MTRKGKLTQALTTILPVLSPVKSPIRAWGILSNPSTTVSRTFKTKEDYNKRKLDFVNYAKLRLKVYEDTMTLTCCQDHILTENIWFVWSKTSYSGDKRRCHYAGRTTNDEHVKIELLSQWMLEAEFRNFERHIKQVISQQQATRA